MIIGIEGIIVGFYSVIIYILVSNIFIFNKYIILFIVGFFKHLFGYYTNLYTYYCNNGNACKNNIIHTTAHIKTYELLIESLFEGLLFLFLGSILFYSKLNINIIYFLIGFILHIIFEILGIHTIFCKKKCKIY